jgi:hypothetical protein
VEDIRLVEVEIDVVVEVVVAPPVHAGVEVVGVAVVEVVGVEVVGVEGCELLAGVE